MNLRDRLKEAREQIKKLLDERAEARKEVESAKEKFEAADHDGPVHEWQEFTDAQEAVKKQGEIDDQLADLRATETGLLEMLGNSQPDRGQHGQAGQGEAVVAQGWSGETLLAGEESAYQRARGEGTFTSDAKFGTILLGQIATREQAVAAFSAGGFMADLPTAPGAPVDTPGVAPAIRPDYRGVQPPVLRRLTFLDLIPKGTTDSNLIEYVQVQAIPGSAAPVAEGEVKPQSGLTLVDATAPVRTIAGWIKVNRQAMDDMAGLATLINSLLPYDVQRQIEKQILTGDGTGQNLKGIYNQTGIGAPAFVSGDNPADSILRAMTTVILQDADPNFAVANPLTWQDIMLMKAEGSGNYLAGGPFSFTAPTIWGLALTASRAVTQQNPLVGDSRGATLLFREGVNIKTSDSDQDDFIRNRVTVLAEARVAFPVWRPASFAIAATS
jgi:hypothetical protein